MHEQTDFSRMTNGFDFTNSETIKHILERATVECITPSGVRISCVSSDGLPVAIAVDLLCHDMVRIRVQPYHIQPSPKEMLAIDPDSLTTASTLQCSSDTVTLQSENLSVHLCLDRWNLQISQKQNDRPFFAQQIDDRCYGPLYESAPCGFDISAEGSLQARLSVCASIHEKWYGFGEVFSPLVRNSQTIDVFCTDAGSVSSPRSYKAMPFFLSSNGYGLLVHTSFPSRFSMLSNCGSSYTITVADEYLEYFVIHGESFKDILKSYSVLTGLSPILPKWSFGLWVSRCGYRNWKEVDEVVSKMKENNIPFDVISLDPWWQGGRPWSTLVWDEDSFENPVQKLHELASQNIKVCLWLNPYVPKNSQLYKEGMQRHFFLRDSNDEVVNITEPFAGDELVAYDLTDEVQVQWLIEQLKVLLQQGVAVFKTDFGEQIPLSVVSSNKMSGWQLHNLYPLLYNRCAFEAVKEVYGIGITWGRSAYIGSVRYPLQWGGDSYASFSQMAGQLRGMLGYGLSGMVYYSHDIGGFDYEPEVFRNLKTLTLSDTDDQAIPDSELYIRWMQLGMFSSHAIIHGKRPHEPYHYSQEALQISRSYIRLRNRMLPYIYTQSILGSKEGLPLARAMVLEFQDDRSTWDIETQYMFGPDILVAPVLQRERETLVYFPKGSWYDLYTGTCYMGPLWQKVPSPLTKIPLFLKAGSCIPIRTEVADCNRAFNDLMVIYTPESQGTSAIVIDMHQNTIDSVELIVDLQSQRATCPKRGKTYPTVLVGSIDLLKG